jgi:hypothetical protein
VNEKSFVIPLDIPLLVPIAFYDLAAIDGRTPRSGMTSSMTGILNIKFVSFFTPHGKII